MVKIVSILAQRTVMREDVTKILAYVMVDVVILLNTMVLHVNIHVLLHVMNMAVIRKREIAITDVQIHLLSMVHLVNMLALQVAMNLDAIKKQVTVITK